MAIGNYSVAPYIMQAGQGIGGSLMQGGSGLGRGIGQGMMVGSGAILDAMKLKTGREFQSAEDLKKRDWQSGESLKERDWKSGETAKQRWLRRELAAMDAQARQEMFEAYRAEKVKERELWTDLLSQQDTAPAGVSRYAPAPTQGEQAAAFTAQQTTVPGIGTAAGLYGTPTPEEIQAYYNPTVYRPLSPDRQQAVATYLLMRPR